MCLNSDYMQSELGEKLKLLRIRRGLNQENIANVLNLTKSQISNVEHGRRNLNLKQLDKLCDYFNIELSYFLFSNTTDSCIDIIDRIKLIFESKELSKEQKDDVFTEIMRIYLDSKE